MMKKYALTVFLMLGLLAPSASFPAGEVRLPDGVRAVWDLAKAHREATSTRERISINGLWRWQPANAGAERVPADGWGYFKVPGCWPGITDYMQKDSQTLYAHPRWNHVNLQEITGAWYQREIEIPDTWANRRISVYAEYVNSYAAVFIDGVKAGQILFPWGEVDISKACRPGAKHTLTMLVLAMPLKGVMLSYNDTDLAKQVKGAVPRRGLCGDVFLRSTPAGPRINDVKVDTSVRKWEVTFHAALHGLNAGKCYRLSARVREGDRDLKEFNSPPFTPEDLRGGRIAFSGKWKPRGLWDIYTPQNMYDLHLELKDAGGKMLDEFHPVRFGFREFWIDGRDFYLNGSRIFLSAVPLDNAQVSAAAATYEGARESMDRLRMLGINFVYTHNYGCQPGAHLSFSEILRAADDLGMLVAVSQPHFGHYDWEADDADRTNGYARHAEFYVRMAQNHPSVVMYSTSHNATGYSEDMNPDLIDGLYDKRDPRTLLNVKKALRAEGIVRSLDPSRIVYHHSSGNLGAMHTSNFYANFVPVQEMSDWFEHWGTKGVKPVFLCEYGVPFAWDWTMYRGWYKGKRAFGSAKVPWEFCLAEWNSQFLGDRAFRISEMEKENLRWEAEQFRAGSTWHRWDYPHRVGSVNLVERDPVFAMYYTDNWRAFRTWGLSANSPWSHGLLYRQREGIDKGRKQLRVDWDALQRPGFSPDYVDRRYERMDLAFDRSDWVPTAAGRALIRNNLPLLAYIGGRPGAFTSKDHNFYAGETIEKQIIVINNSRARVNCKCSWSMDLARSVKGHREVTVETGDQTRIPLRFHLPQDLKPGRYELKAQFVFSTGEVQEDRFEIHLLPRREVHSASVKVALFDPEGQTGEALKALGIRYKAVDGMSDLSGYDLFVVGKEALTTGGPDPDIGRVRAGLRVIVFEQTSEVLEKRFGFRVQEYGLRNVTKRIPDHPILFGLEEEYLRDWRGEATLLAPRREYYLSRLYNYVPTVTRCGMEVTRPWRCGCRGNVASVLIEKPTCGDFLPIVDGGYSLQYSPLMEYREGKGMILFCQMDVTGRTERDPAGEILVRNLVDYALSWKPMPRRESVYVGEAAGKEHLVKAGLRPKPFRPHELTVDKVLVVGPGGGRELRGYRDVVRAFLEGGGCLLAVGLNQEEMDGFLPFEVTIRETEHINAYFEPFGTGSLLQAVGPADVHNRAPRTLPLVSKGPQVVGDGVLAFVAQPKVVFCQLAPWQFDYRNDFGLKRTFRRAGYLLTRLLGNMGVGARTPLISRFSVPASPAGLGSRCTQGLYLDEPEEMDDPYRFFRW